MAVEKLGEIEILGVKLDSPSDIKIYTNPDDEIHIELPLCYRDKETGEIKCTGKYIATYKKGFIGPVKLEVRRE